MAQGEAINFHIPDDRMNDFISSRLVEIQAQLISINQQQKLIYAELMKDDPDFNFEEYCKSAEGELRRLRLELCATFTQRFS